MNADSASKARGLASKVAKVAIYPCPEDWEERGIWSTAGLYLITSLIVVFMLGHLLIAIAEIA